MEEISCIFCGIRSSYIAITENGYTGLKCRECNLIYISPRPNAAEVTNLYSEDHAVLYADAQFQFEKVKRTEAALTLSKIKHYKKRGSILELGAGGGSFLLEARKWGYEAYGIELNPIEARWVNEDLRIPCESVPLNERSFGGRQFDIIYHKDVLSHLYDPISVFRDMKRALKKDGVLVFETGNIGELDERYYKFFSQFLYPDHLFFFGEKSLNMLLERSGFKRVGIFRYPILPQLLLQKALWSFKDGLKDRRPVEEGRSRSGRDFEGGRLSLKRCLRLLYRYATVFLIRVSRILPKRGKPLKLLFVAQKECETAS